MIFLHSSHKRSCHRFRRHHQPLLILILSSKVYSFLSGPFSRLTITLRTLYSAITSRTAPHLIKEIINVIHTNKFNNILTVNITTHRHTTKEKIPWKNITLLHMYGNLTYRQQKSWLKHFLLTMRYWIFVLGRYVQKWTNFVFKISR